MIKLEQLQRGRVYRLQSRNLECGVWNGKDGFVGIRTKFGGRFLDMEIHWDLSETFGTYLPSLNTPGSPIIARRWFFARSSAGRLFTTRTEEPSLIFSHAADRS
jgi:hypothetical protein